MSKFQNTLNVYSYCQFRTYMKDYFALRKESSEKFSLTVAVKETGLAKSTIWRIMEGEIPLSERSKIMIFSKMFGFNRDERRFFEHLVDFNQAQTGEDALERLEYLMESIPDDQQDVFVARFASVPWWLTQAMREIAQMDNWDGSFMSLSEAFYPETTPNEMKKALSILEQNGHIEKVGKGKYITPEVINRVNLSKAKTEDEIDFARKAVMALQCKQLELIQDAANEFDLDRCLMINHTVSIPEEAVPELQDLIKGFRDQIGEVMSKYPSSGTNQIFQISSAMTAITKPIHPKSTSSKSTSSTKAK